MSQANLKILSSLDTFLWITRQTAQSLIWLELHIRFIHLTTIKYFCTFQHVFVLWAWGPLGLPLALLLFSLSSLWDLHAHALIPGDENLCTFRYGLIVSYRRPGSLKYHSNERFERGDYQVQKKGSGVREIVLLLTKRCTASIFLSSFENDVRSHFFQAKHQYSCTHLLGSILAEDWPGW